jgi:hypothetical protein
LLRNEQESKGISLGKMYNFFYLELDIIQNFPINIY